jgi:signal peptidase II
VLAASTISTARANNVSAPSDHPWRRWQRWERWLWLAGVVIVLDQISKGMVLAALRPGDSVYVAPFFNWVLTFNRGAAFSFLSDAGGWQRWFFTVLALGVSVWIVAMLRRHAGEFRLSLALTMILGGALGNVIDRIRFGAVVDFVQWHAAGYAWPAFNVADSAITLGAVLLAWDQFAAKPPAEDGVKSSPTGGQP